MSLKNKIPTQIKKIALFTDIHWGKKNNSKIHNQDCLDYVNWFCTQVKDDPSITHIAFLGDWFESRSAINIETLDMSYQGLKMIDALGLPIFFIVGNHDLHKRHTREIHSVNMFNEFKNIQVIDKPIEIDGLLFSPYLFEDEYKKLAKHNDCWAWLGHFEFRSFIITGYNVAMTHGPEHTLFKGPKKIFSGHFHKRQAKDNVVYIGNVFPMDFGDASDYARGMAVYDVLKDHVSFYDWDDCPKYYKTTLSKVIDSNWKPLSKMKVKCLVDADITYTDAQEIKAAMIEAHNLREFILEENKMAKQELLEGEEVDAEEEFMEFASIDELVINQLESLTQDKCSSIDPAKLVKLYKDLKIDNLRAAEE